MLKLTEKRAVYATHIERKISKHNKIVRKALATLAVPALLAASLSANAANTACTVEWIATENGQIAMQPVSLIIIDRKTHAVVKTTSRKSGYFVMPCGNYTATAKMGTVVRSLGMNLISSFRLVIDMGVK